MLLTLHCLQSNNFVPLNFTSKTRAKQHCSYKSQTWPYKHRPLMPHNQLQSTRLGEIFTILRCIQGCMVLSLRTTEALQQVARLGLLFLQLTLHRPETNHMGIRHKTASHNNAPTNSDDSRDYSTATECLISTTGMSLYTYNKL